jgi:aminoglycoside phosphotransferase (APT) family kinase protein
MDSAEIEIQALRSLLGTGITGIAPLVMGRSNSRTYLVATDNDEVVAKISDDADALARSEHNLTRLRALGIPVPEVIAYDGSFSSYPFAVLVMTKLDGRDLHYEIDSMSPSQLTELAAQIIGFQERAATIPVLDKCGFAGVDEPAHRLWADVVMRPNGHTYANPLPADVAPLHERLIRQIERMTPVLNALTPSCYLDDLTTKNVLMKNGELCGVVDFDVVAYGDPLFHLGLTAAAVKANANRPAWFYLEELNRLSNLTPDQEQRRNLYEAVFLINFLGAESPNKPGQWRKVAATSVDECLAAIE